MTPSCRTKFNSTTLRARHSGSLLWLIFEMGGGTANKSSSQRYSVSAGTSSNHTCRKAEKLSP